MSDSLQTAFRTLLAADTGTATLVGSRIRPDELDQDDTLPGVILEVESDDALDDLAAAASSEGQAVVAVACCAETRSQATEVELAVRSRLNGYRGSVGEITLDPVTYSGTTEEFEPAADDSERDWYINTARFDVFYRRSD